MDKLDQYFKLQKEIYEYFGYVEDWAVIPLDDQTNMYWFLDEASGTVKTADIPLTNDLILDGEYDVYSYEIYTRRLLPKWVYRGPEYTMISVDTHCDGNKFLMVFDNTKEIAGLELY